MNSLPGSASSMVSVTGTGMVSCAGLGVQALLKSFSLGDRSARTHVANGLGPIRAEILNQIKTQYPDVAHFSPAALFAYASIREAMDQAGWDQLNQDDGIILGTTTGQISLWENELIQYLKSEISIDEFADRFRHQSMGLILNALSDALGFHGKTLLLTSACSASTQAIGMGALWIQTGVVKRCLVGGTEVLSRLTVDGFRSLQLLSPEPCRPFDQNRNGINLSEGAGFLALEAQSSRALAQMSGYGFSTDAYHMASPQPEGKGSLKAMKNALEMAQITPEEVSWSHAHGTGSKANDQAEGRAIHDVFLNQAIPPVTSTKWVHGHALAASGAIESILCIEAMNQNLILKTEGLLTPDPEIPVPHQMHTLTDQPVEHVLKNTLGFGGNNAALVISNARTQKRSSPEPQIQKKIGILGAGFSSLSDALHYRQNPRFRKATGNMILAFDAIQKCMQELIPEVSQHVYQSAAFVMGSSYGEIENTKDFLKALVVSGIARPLLFQSSLHNATLGFLSLELGMTGASFTVSQRYFTGEKCLDTALQLLQAGVADCCLVSATDVMSEDLLPSLKIHSPHGLHWESGAGAVLLGTEEMISSLHATPLAWLNEIQFLASGGAHPQGAFYDSNGIEQLARDLKTEKSESILISPKPDSSFTQISWSRSLA